MNLFFEGNGKSVLKGMENQVLNYGKNAGKGQEFYIYADSTVVLKDGVYYITKA